MNRAEPRLLNNSGTERIPDQADVVICGGGIWGLSVAWHLAERREGARIVVLERNSQLADETTRQAAGQIGQLRSQAVMARGVAYTLSLLRTFYERTGHDPGLRTPGSLHLALDERRRAAFERHVASCAGQALSVELVEPEVLGDFSPLIDPHAVCGALFVPGDGYVNARQTALAYGSAAQAAGAEVVCGVACEKIQLTDNGSVHRVETSQGTIRCQQLIVTAGPWTARMLEPLGTGLPVWGLRLQQARTGAHSGATDTHPVIRIPDASCYLRPEEGGFLFGYFDRDPLPLDPRQLGSDWKTDQLAAEPGLIDAARQLLAAPLPWLVNSQLTQFRQGIVTCAPDGWYVLGPVRKHPGLWVATGCAAMGIAGSGAVGKWLSNWILDGHPGEDLSPMRPERLPELVSDPDSLQRACRDTFSNYYSLTRGATYSVGQEAS